MHTSVVGELLYPNGRNVSQLPCLTSWPYRHRVESPLVPDPVAPRRTHDEICVGELLTVFEN